MPRPNESVQNGTKKLTNLHQASLLFVGGLLATTLFWVTIYFVFERPMIDIANFANAWIVNETPLNLPLAEREYIKELVDKGHILSPEAYLTSTVDFYESVIQILFGVIGLLGFVAFVYVRAISRNDAEKIIEHDVGTYFASNDFRVSYEVHAKNAFSSYVRNEIEPLINENIDTQNAATDMLEELKTLKEQIENTISDQDRSEADEGELELRDPDLDQEPEGN